jgi:hypothetical protein
MATPQALFTIQLSLQTRDFVGNSSGAILGDVSVECDSAACFNQKLFDLVKDHWKREVLFTHNNESQLAVWHEKETPDETDLKRFVVLHDKIGKVKWCPSQVTPTILQNWRNKTICCWIHVYSKSVSSNALFSVVKKTLLQPERRDRANAATTQSLITLKAELKEKHHQYTAMDISWQLWANYILHSEPHLHSTLIEDCPPSHLIHFFSRVPVNEAEILDITRRGIAVAKNFNHQNRLEMDRLKNEFEILNQALQPIIRNFQVRMKGYDEQLLMQNGIIEALEHTVGPVEHAYGRNLILGMTNVPDVDHAMQEAEDA